MKELYYDDIFNDNTTLRNNLLNMTEKYGEIILKDLLKEARHKVYCTMSFPLTFEKVPKNIKGNLKEDKKDIIVTNVSLVKTSEKEIENILSLEKENFEKILEEKNKLLDIKNELLDEKDFIIKKLTNNNYKSAKFYFKMTIIFFIIDIFTGFMINENYKSCENYQNFKIYNLTN